MAGNPNAVRNLMSNKDAIRRIMAMDANGKMDKIAENARNNGTLVGGADGVTYNAPTTPQKPSQPQQIVVNENVMKNHARMPKKILESFRDNPIQEAEISSSVLDGLNIPTPVQQAPVIQESAPVPTTQSAPIDYALIKTIINEAVEANVKKYVSAMCKKLIQENKSNDGVAAIKISKNGFSFITENQDIYSCKPTFQRNIND